MVTRTRTPLIAGLSGGAGASTLAAALHALDGGRLAGPVCGGADVLVCRSGDGLHLAAATVCPQPGPPPVLVVTMDPVTAGPDPSTDARLRALARRFGAVVMLPQVARWHGRAVPLDEAAAVLAQPAAHLPRAVRAYAAALREIAAALVASGQLLRATPPAVVVPRSAGTARTAVRPIARAVPPRPTLLAPADRTPADRTPAPPNAEPDDDDLESDLLRVLVGVGRAG